MEKIAFLAAGVKIEADFQNMVSWTPREAMKTIVRRLGIGAGALALAVCALAAAKTPASPLRFPLSEAARLGYDGDIRRAVVTSGGALFFSTDKGFVYGLTG